jgi:hypothetical protein
MRYVKIPKRATFNGTDVDMRLVVAQLIMVDVRWRDEWADEWAEAQIAADALSVAYDDEYVGVVDEIQERFAVALKGATIMAPFVPIVMPFVHAITRASNKKPEA